MDEKCSNCGKKLNSFNTDRIGLCSTCTENGALTNLTVVKTTRTVIIDNDFITYDDDLYITENSHVKAGITRDSIVWAFTKLHFYMWHPLTSLSHMLDCQLFGMNPHAHHLMSLFFHILNTLILFMVLKEMTGTLWPSAFVAALFGLHPLAVESVAWAAERKTVLSGLFQLLTIAAYNRYARRPGVWRRSRRNEQVVRGL